MICYNCNNKVSIHNEQCDYCGENLTTLQKTYKLSNSYYNMGLTKAKVRDLTGAIFVLKKSLELNKRNTNARNLLGLIYYEMGEIVSALSEWVIGKHHDPENTNSEYYIEAVQSNPTKLDTLSQAIKKYNIALSLANQGNDDLAIIQLRKVVNLNPNYIKAMQLLALLYLNNEEYDKAFKYLKRARRIDVSNTTTLKYLKEVEAYTDKINKPNNKSSRERQIQADRQTTYVSSPYKEERPNLGLFISLIAGIVIGVVASVILIIPTVRENAVNQFRDSEVEYNAEISKKDQEISSLQGLNEDLQGQIDKLEIDLTSAKETVEEVIDSSSYDSLMEATRLYLDGTTNNDLDHIAVADAISEVEASDLDNSDAVNLYNRIKDEVYLEASGDLYNEGHGQYSNGNYEDALATLNKAYEYNPTDVNAIYFIGRTYHQMEDYDKAREYYNILTEEYPATGRAREATSRLQEIE